MSYSRKELDAQYEALDEGQKKVLDDYVIRGMKTKWLNAWVSKLGEEMQEEALKDIDATMEALLEWVLVDFKDYGSVRKDITCQCGRKLRYRYTIINTKTGVVYQLGAIHFQEHTGINPETARRVLKELKKIDLEKDELLTKIKDKWQLHFKIPEGLEIPEDMRAQIRVNLPLLERQEKRLYESIRNYNIQSEQAAILRVLEKIDPLELLKKLGEQPDKLSLEELKALRMSLEKRPSLIEAAGLSLRDFKKVIQQAEGSTLNRAKRACLVDLEYMDFDI